MESNIILPPKTMDITRVVSALFLILPIAILPLGCRQDESKIRIGVSIPRTTAPTYTLMREKIIELGKKEKHNVEIIWNGVKDQGSTKNHIALEKRRIEEMFNLDIKALVLKPLDPKLAYAIVYEAKNRNPPVPVISLDQMITGVSTYGHITVNEISLGEQAAQYLINQISGKGKVLVLEGPIGIPSLRNISIGVYNVLNTYKQIHIHNRASPLNEQSASSTTDQVLRDYAKNIQAILAVDSCLAVGAIQAVQLHGMTDLILTVGVGASQAACQLVIEGQHDAEVDLQPAERGEEAFKAAMNAIEQKPFDFDQQLQNGGIMTKVKFASSRIITKSNYTLVKKMWPDLFKNRNGVR